MEVAIIGGGASGTLSAARLLDVLPNSRIWLVERSSEVARGVAYGTDQDCHLLNVRAGNMSANPDDRDEFVRWLHSQGLNDPDLASQFAPRRMYGRYLTHVLDQAQATSSSELVVIRDEAISLTRDGSLKVGFRKHAEIQVDKVVLAMGNLPPSLPRFVSEAECSERVIGNPWAKGAIASIPKDARVLIVGTGLTMVDLVLSLRAANHTGLISARSRHGLLARAHGPETYGHAEIEPGDRLVQRIIAMIRSEGDDWRAVVDALRPRSVELWQSLTWKQRSQFRSRLQVFWDVHRHRLPPEVAQELDRLRAEGLLDVGKGRIERIVRSDHGVRVEMSGPRGLESLEVDVVVNCTGPAGDLRSAKLPILETAVRAGLVEYDPLSLGVMVGNCGRAGLADDIWAIGPMCRGCRLETTAMPEIRAQAKRLAQEIYASSFEPSSVAG